MLSEATEFVGWDTETHLITDEAPIPKIVVHSFYYPGGEPVLDKSPKSLLEAVRWVYGGDRAIVAHNLEFDFSVAVVAYPEMKDLLFRALWDEKFVCSKMLHKLVDNARGQPPHDRSLASVVREYCGEDLNKGEDTWRLRYAELEDVALESWPEAASEYAKYDAVYCSRITTAVPWWLYPDWQRQSRYAVALRFMATWGFVVDKQMVQFQIEKREKENEVLAEQLVVAGLLRVGGTKGAPRLVKNQQAVRDAVESALLQHGLPVERTASGSVKTDVDVLNVVESVVSDHPALALAKYKKNCDFFF